MSPLSGIQRSHFRFAARETAAFWYGDEVALKMCAEPINIGPVWADYCKLPVGHDGDHSADPEVSR